MNAVQSAVRACGRGIEASTIVRHHDHEAIARAAIATMFNWLGDPSQPAVDAGVVASHSDARTCRLAWSAILSELRKEAGF